MRSYGRFADARTILRRMDEKDARINLAMAQRAPLPLPKCCSTCEHFDGDLHCALPEAEKLIHGFIHSPSAVVCVRHQEKDRG